MSSALLFAVSGYTMWLSSAGRSRTKVLSYAIMLTLTMFLVNVIGQLWDGLAFLRPFTVFYYYQPQAINMKGLWTIDPGVAITGRHLLSVVNGILDMSKMKTGNFQITVEPFAPSQVVTGC